MYPAIAEEDAEHGSGKQALSQKEIDKSIGRMGESIFQVPEGYQFSEAEIKMWFSDHLENITEPTQLLYEFTKSGTYEEGFVDSVQLVIKELNEDGTKNADMQFFTGERKQFIRPENITNITGNPVLGIYMQGDIYEMDRYTGGSWRYFLKSIKTSIHDEAVIEPVEFEFSGNKYAGEKVSFSPYLNDPRRMQIGKFAGKSYELIFCDQIPGQLYQIRTVIPSEEDGSEPLVEEILTLAEIGS
ncbi:MAG: hypothetical protein MI673_00160 [Thiotrichales bacterium]|nr:hypothetical protein [Thiotrichales bacterium]